MVVNDKVIDEIRNTIKQVLYSVCHQIKLNVRSVERRGRFLGRVNLMTSGWVVIDSRVTFHINA